MQKIIEVIKLIADKYRDKVNAIISEDALIIEYLYEISGEKDVYKTIEVDEKDGILYANTFPQKEKKIISINDLEEMFQEIENEIISKKKAKQDAKQEEKYKNYLEMFDKLFDTNAKEHIDFKKLTLLKSFHEFFIEELYTPSKEYNKLRKEFVDYADNVREQLTEEQKNVFDKAIELCNEMTAEQDEQAFIFGSIMGHKLKLELANN